MRPGPFGSGGLFFVWVEFLLVRLQESVFFSLERNIIVFAVWDRSAPGAGFGHVRSVTV